MTVVLPAASAPAAAAQTFGIYEPPPAPTPTPVATTSPSPMGATMAASPPGATATPTATATATAATAATSSAVPSPVPSIGPGAGSRRGTEGEAEIVGIVGAPGELPHPPSDEATTSGKDTQEKEKEGEETVWATSSAGDGREGEIDL